MSNLHKEKVLILGSDSFLGNSFANFLSTKDVEVLRASSANSNDYELQRLEAVISENNPLYILDYQFKLVSSKNEDYVIYEKQNFFKAQNNLISILNKTKETNKKVYLISTKYVENNNSTYSNLKREQENIYKSHLNKNISFEILRINSIFGQGDKNLNRALPHFFYSIFNNRKAVFESTGNQKTNFSFVEEANRFVYKKAIQNKNVKLNNFVCTYYELINYISQIILENFAYEHSVEWAEEKKEDFKLDVSNEDSKNIHKTINWYFENMEEIKLLNG